MLCPLCPPFTPIARQIMEVKYGDRDNWPRTSFVIKRACKLLSEQGVCDLVDTADNRDGTFELGWSKIAGQASRSCVFSSIDEPWSSLFASLESRLTRGVRSNETFVTWITHCHTRT